MINFNKHVVPPVLRRRIRLALYVPWLLRDCLYCWLCGVHWHWSWRFWGLPLMYRTFGSTIRIGIHFTACSQSKHNSIGVSQSVVLKTNAATAILVMGHHVGVSGCSIAATERIEIGNHVMIGSGCLITDSDAHALDLIGRRNNVPCYTSPIVIEDDVFIGARSIILKGVRLGRGCIIGAGSVVTQDIPPMVVAAGNPCRVLRRL